MRIREDFELLEALLVELDPLEDGFSGVLLEVYRREDRYVLLEMALATGNRLLRFSSKDRGLVPAVLAGELGGPLGGEGSLKSWLGSLPRPRRSRRLSRTSVPQF